MTLNDLKDELSALGFEREIDIDKNLVFAVKRALSTIYTERGVYNALSISHHPLMPTLVCKSLTHVPGKSENFTLIGKAYSFTVSGTGYFAINDAGIRTEHAFSSPLYLFKGFISGEATLTFFGDFSFEVFSIAAFETIRSEREEELFSYGEPFEYRMSEIRNDFHSFVALPTDSFGNEIKNSAARGDRLIIPWGYQGNINVIYKVKPPEVSADYPDRELALATEILHLVPLLSAAYYWADDAPDKAEYYLALYKEAMRSAKQFNTRRITSDYKDVTGWA